LGDGQVGEVSFEELDAGNVIEIAALTRDQTVGDTHGMAAANEFFAEMRTDEPGAAGDEVVRHVACLSNIRAHASISHRRAHSGAGQNRRRPTETAIL
jgi:hypothetical protein